MAPPPGRISTATSGGKRECSARRSAASSSRAAWRASASARATSSRCASEMTSDRKWPHTGAGIGPAPSRFLGVAGSGAVASVAARDAGSGWVVTISSLTSETRWAVGGHAPRNLRYEDLESLMSEHLDSVPLALRQRRSASSPRQVRQLVRDGWVTADRGPAPPLSNAESLCMVLSFSLN